MAITEAHAANSDMSSVISARVAPSNPMITVERYTTRRTLSIFNNPHVLKIFYQKLDKHRQN